MSTQVPSKWEKKGFTDCYYTVTSMTPRVIRSGGKFGGVVDVGVVYQQGITWQGKGGVDMAGESHA